MERVYKTPGGNYSPLYRDMAKQPHLLIAGATGSGKSVVINGIMQSLLLDSPCKVGFILIDPKRVELAKYADLPHTVCHAKGFDPAAWLKALQTAVAIMDKRYTDMERCKQVMYTGPDLYVVIDEYANVFKNGGPACFRAILRLVSEGRAARVHCIVATQVPKSTIIPTEVRENFTARLCLRCNTKSQSRVLMDLPGCEQLPIYGYGYYITPGEKQLYKLPMYNETEINRLIDYWTGPAGKGRIKLFSRG